MERMDGIDTIDTLDGIDTVFERRQGRRCSFNRCLASEARRRRPGTSAGAFAHAEGPPATTGLRDT
jgi:hypothetical protein